jgi:hypothetical protein
MHLAQFVGRELLQQAGEGALAGHVKLPVRSGPWTAAQPASSAMVETDWPAMTDAAGVARVWQSLVDGLPKRVHPGGLDRRQGGAGRLGSMSSGASWLARSRSKA